MSQITTHVLNTATGTAAVGVKIVLYVEAGKLADNETNWQKLKDAETDADGRVLSLLSSEELLVPGNYKLKFETQTYFSRLKVESFFPYVEIVFSVTDASHYHVPLLISPFGYSTYRGS